jgi:hypothetical protein
MRQEPQRLPRPNTGAGKPGGSGKLAGADRVSSGDNVIFPRLATVIT